MLTSIVRRGHAAVTFIVFFSATFLLAENLAPAQAPKKPGTAPAAPQPNSTSANRSTSTAEPSNSGKEQEFTGVTLGEDRRVLVRLPDDPKSGNTPGSGEVVVARVHCEFNYRQSRNMMVVLPDGQLAEINAREVTDTDRPFVPTSKEELGKQITALRAFRGFKVKQTNRFLYIYNSSDLFYQGTSRILETMYPGVLAYSKKQKLPVHEAELPLVVIMFRTQAEFDAYRKMPDGVVAYYDGLTNRVCMYEMSQLSQVAPDIALKQAISTISHEGVHQILMNIGVQQRLSRWPMWISEGLPEFFSPTEVSKDIRWKGVGKVNDLRMYELEKYFRQSSAGAGSGRTIRVTATTPTLSSTGYASAWALTHFLSEKRPVQFLAFMQEVSQRKPLETYDRDADEELFVKHFGADFDGLEDKLLVHLRSLPYIDPIAARKRTR